MTCKVSQSISQLSCSIYFHKKEEEKGWLKSNTIICLLQNNIALPTFTQEKKFLHLQSFNTLLLHLPNHGKVDRLKISRLVPWLVHKLNNTILVGNLLVIQALWAERHNLLFKQSPIWHKDLGHIHNINMGPISSSACPCQTLPASCNVTRQLNGPVSKLRR